MLNIIIPDPGLREYGGHHPAMINSIANTQSVIKGDIHLEVYCNKACSDDFINSTQSKQVTIKKHFNIDFYKYFYQPTTQAKLNSYINQLTKEYLYIFQQHTITNKQNNKPERSKTLFLYHTLSGEHATALAAAISIHTKYSSTPIQHCVFLMYNPIKYNENGVLNVQHFLTFKLGFASLIKQINVQFFAAEEELQQHYQHLLSNQLPSSTNKNSNSNLQTRVAKQTISIHPCGLLSQNYSQIKKTNSIILFTGDAKVNKGFLQLPNLVEQTIKRIKNQNVKFIIQYTITNNSEALKQTNNHLQRLSELDSRIQLTTRFWSHTELHENFARANSIVFNYDSAIYQNQSSGVLWLAASYNLKMVFLTTNWLTREAKKLECRFCKCKIIDLPKELDKNYVSKEDKLDNIPNNNYRKLLFEDIGKWLVKLM
jgi:hypothetical protein